MANQYKNKVVFDNTTLIDISDTTATAEDVAAGKVFYLASGEQAVGTARVISNDDTIMYIAQYGKSTYADVLDAYQHNNIIYCRAGTSTSNPASGNQLRMAFLAYINNETTPTEFEFQYYRSVASHSNTQQGDQVYIYKLKKTSGWEFSIRETYTKVIAGTGLTSSYANGAITLSVSS